MHPVTTLFQVIDKAVLACIRVLLFHYLHLPLLIKKMKLRNKLRWFQDNTCNIAFLSSLRWANATYNGFPDIILPFISVSCVSKDVRDFETTPEDTTFRKHTYSLRCFLTGRKRNKAWPLANTILITHYLLNKFGQL